MTSPIESASDDLQFETAEPAETADQSVAAQKCARCQRSIRGEYYAVRQHVVCPACSAALQPPPPGTRFTRFAKAFGLGLGAGLVGAIIWYVVRRVTQMEIGLIAVLVGFLVGKAVRFGSGNRGGRGYQVLAVVLTYCCIAANYMPDILQGLLQEAHKDDQAAVTTDNGPTAQKLNSAAQNSPAAKKSTEETAAPSAEATPAKPKPSLARFAFAVIVVVAVVFGISMAAPFLMGASNILGLIIIGFALWEAWKFNRRIPLPISGPYRLSGGVPPVPGTIAGGAV